MSYLKRILALTALLLAVGCSSVKLSAPVPPMEEVDAMTAFIMYELQLDQETEMKVREIIIKNLEMKRAIRMQYAMRPLEMREREYSRMKKLDQQIKSLLTSSEQRKVLKKVLSEIRNNEMKGLATNAQPPVMPSGRQGTGNPYGY